MEDADFVGDSDEDEHEDMDTDTLGNDCSLVEERLEHDVSVPIRHEDEQMEHDTKVLTVKEQRQSEEHTFGKQVQYQSPTAKEHDCDHEDKKTVLDLGTLVDVDSRTWPGINKLGGAGRIVRVHQVKSTAKNEFFYDVRYVLGGCERYVASKWVHSSELLKKQSNREKVSRDYYHDNFINRPYREAEKRRQYRKTRVDHLDRPMIRQGKRKRYCRAEEVADKIEQDQSDAEENQQVVNETMFVLSDRNEHSRKDSSRSYGDNVKSKPLEIVDVNQNFVLKQLTRRRNRIVSSSDEESSDNGDVGVNERTLSDQDKPMKHADAVFTDGKSAQVSRDRNVRRSKQKAKRRRYVGGYERNGEDADAMFIQPEGDPAELPEDVIRETGLKLASTKEELMGQLEETFAQQQKNMANFHDEQNKVNQQLKNLVEMSSADLRKLYNKICELRIFVTKTLVNAGEDAMNKIIDSLHVKRGKPPDSLEHLECNIDVWQLHLNECSSWLKNIESAVESAFARREEDILQEDEFQAVCSSDSGESSNHTNEHDSMALHSSAATNVDNVYSNHNELGFDYDDEEVYEENDASKQPRGQSKHASQANIRDSRFPRSVVARSRKQMVKNTTLDDYILRQGFHNGLTSNVRLVGRQYTYCPSDPRWNWLKMARKKKMQRVGRTNLASSPMRFSDGVENVCKIQDKRARKVLSCNDSKSVQDQLINFRNKRFRVQPSQYRSQDFYLAPRILGSTSRYAYPAGISFENGISEKSLLEAETIDHTMHVDSLKQSHINWETVFEVVCDSPITSVDQENDASISRQVQTTLLAFGYEICGPLTPHHLLFDKEYTFGDCDSMCDVVKRRVARLRQLVNDLRLQESNFMTSLPLMGLDDRHEAGYAAAPGWIALVLLEETYHTALASFAAHLVKNLDATFPTAVASHTQVILNELAVLLRQLPDCDSIFTGCKAYFFFFEVASTDATTTPLLTAISRTYWYCLKLLIAIQSRCDHLTGPHAAIKTEIEHIFLTTLPVNRVTLAVVLFLFDLCVYLPSSHSLEKRRKNQLQSGQLPALSLWMLIRSCCTSSIGQDQPWQESVVTNEKYFWALLQAAYRQHYFDELAWCFIHNESCGGYLRDYASKATSHDTSEACNEVFKSQLLALEVTWNLLAVLTRILTYGDGHEHEEAVCDAKWALVRDLLHPEKQDFVPFKLADTQLARVQPGYRQRAHVYKQHVLQRVILFSKLWFPCKEVIQIIMHQLWENDVVHHPDEIVELPQFLKQFITRCKELGNSRSNLATFAEEVNYDNSDSTTLLCKIIWIQVLKLQKRVHRSRFRRSVLSAIPNIPINHDGSTPSMVARSVSAQPIILKPSQKNWSWGSQQHTSTSMQPADQSMAVSQRNLTSCGVETERMSSAILLTFAIVGVCLECGDEQQFSVQRSDKDTRYMEREVDFFCKEILRRISRKPGCEVLSSQALYVLGALLLEKSSTEFPAVFWALNDRLESSMKSLQANAFVSLKQSAETKGNVIKARSINRHRRRHQSAAMSPLYQMRDLIKKMLATPSSGVRMGPAYGSAVEKCLEHVFSSGMEACLYGAIQKVVAVNDLKIAMEMFHLILPRLPDEPKQCITREFDDLNDEALAAFDLEGAIAGHDSAGRIGAWRVNDCRVKVVQLITRNLRVVLQQLVLNYPSSDAPSFDELYAIDLLGRIISTSGARFFWSNVTSMSVKPRNLASRVLSAALKYNADKEWLGSVFLKENGADRELAATWILGTLDVSSLNPALITFEVGDVPFSVINSRSCHATAAARFSDSWVMLTDGIIYHMLRKQPAEFLNMDPQIWQLLHGVASTCKFTAEISANEDGVHDATTLYDLHLDVFQSFCKSAGSIWRLCSASSARNRDEQNQFRAKMVTYQFGIFASFLEAFKINFRRACGEIDQMNHNWHSFAELFLRQAGVDIDSTNKRSYHEIDDTIRSFDERLTGLTTMFRFMYQCMDAFLFYCGDMAIGETNLFFNAIEILFRQVISAEYPQALKRLEDQRLCGQRKRTRNVNGDLRQEFCPAAVRFVDSVQLFFARQKYPSLLHWFAQTSEIYQTYKNGWQRSPLRTLLTNILDPEGPLGIHSYCGVSGDSPDVRIVRREAFYLSCGLFNCRCTRSFEHSRAEVSPSAFTCLQHLRHFVLNDYMKETFVFARQQDMISLLETMVPLCQFVRGVLNHANMNVHVPRTNQATECDVGRSHHHVFQLSELQPCLEWMVACLIKLLPGEEAVNNTISCVLVIELCGIICEAIVFNEHQPMLELIDLVELVLTYLQTIHVALLKRTTATINALFTTSVESLPSVKLQSYRFFSSAFRDLVVAEQSRQVPGQLMDSYGISIAWAMTDLLAAIERVAQQCHVSSDKRLQSLTTL